MSYHEVISRALKKFNDCKLEEAIPESLPLVDELCSERLAPDIFTDTEVLFIQHHLGPFIPRLEAMLRHGLDPSNCWFIDIPYSTNDCVVGALERIGMPLHQRSTRFNDPIAPYSSSQLERVANVLYLLSSQDKVRRLLVVDDGAYFIRTLETLLPRDPELVMSFARRRTYLVEQTTRGHRHLETEAGREMLRKLNIPATSIARSQTKYQLESPFIGAAVSRAAVRALRDSGVLDKGIGRTLVIGFGAVGKATTLALSSLEHDGPICVWDEEWQSLRSEIEKISGTLALQSFPSEGPFDSVFGCTGYASFPIDKVGILSNDAILMSGSSAAIEFNREKFIDLAYEFADDDFYVIEPEKTRNAGIHATITMQKGDKRFSFLNAGFPVNFDGSLECLPALIIQITHGLLLSASQQALCIEPGFHKLSEQEDDWFYQRGMHWIEQYSEES